MAWGTRVDHVALLETLPKAAYVQLSEPLQMVAAWSACMAALVQQSGQLDYLRAYLTWLDVYG